MHLADHFGGAVGQRADFDSVPGGQLGLLVAVAASGGLTCMDEIFGAHRLIHDVQPSKSS